MVFEFTPDDMDTAEVCTDICQVWPAFLVAHVFLSFFSSSAVFQNASPEIATYAHDHQCKKL